MLQQIVLDLPLHLMKQTITHTDTEMTITSITDIIITASLYSNNLFLSTPSLPSLKLLSAPLSMLPVMLYHIIYYIILYYKDQCWHSLSLTKDPHNCPIEQSSYEKLKLLNGAYTRVLWSSRLTQKCDKSLLYGDTVWHCFQLICT